MKTLEVARPESGTKLPKIEHQQAQTQNQDQSEVQ